MPPYVDTNSDSQTSASNAEQYHIRAMTVTDIPSVVQIDQTTWGDDSWDTEYLLDMLVDPFYNCWILESPTNDYPILGYGFQRSSNGISHITNLCLHPQYRGRGLGGVLLRYIIDYARCLHTPIVELEVNTCNISAYSLYVKHGFTISQLLEEYYSNTDDAYRMRLHVDNIDE